MLVLISFGLVLVATVLLVLGLVQDSGLNLIYVSIASSLAAGVILVVATRVNRPKVDVPAIGSAPTTGADAPVAAPPPRPEAAIVASVDEEFAPVTEAVPAVVVSAAADDDMFPIADYDDLSVGEIVPLLPKLYADEIDVVADRERAGKNRRQIITRLAELDALLQGAPDDVTGEEWAAQKPAAPARKAAPAKKAAPAPARKAAPAKKAAPAPARKAAPATKAAPAKKAAPAPARKAAPAPARKAAPAPARKAISAKKAAPAPARKAASAKKAAPAPAKKAAPAPAKKAAKATKKR